jgi:Fur family transcriptional regulator, ferric uptake regulator
MITTEMKKFEALLRQKGVTPTPMRLLVLDFLNRQETASSLTEVELGLERSDRVTIYRTVKTFEEQGLVHRIDDGSGVVKFALCQDNCDPSGHQDLHVHFYCNTCRKTHCLPKVRIPEIALPAEYRALTTELMIRGICSGCSGKT